LLESLVVTLREGLEAALVVAIVVAYLRKAGRAELSRMVFYGLGAGVLGSLALGFVLLRVPVNEELFEGVTMLVASVFVASMVIWMWRTAKGMKRGIEERIGRSLAKSGPAAAAGIFAFVFVMVLREGAETVVLLSALSLNTSDLLSAIGAVLGLVLAIVFGVLLVRGSVRIDFRRFFAVTGWILLLVSVQLFLSGIHELSEAQVLPASEREMAIVGPIVANNIFFFVAILGLTLVLLLAGVGRTNTPAVAPAAASDFVPNPAERRKEVATLARDRRVRTLGASLALLILLLLTGGFVYSKKAEQLSPAKPVVVSDGRIRVPLAEIADGGLHRYALLRGDAVPVRFILIQIPGGKIGAGFDACEICGDLGYFQRGPDVICKNCDAAIYIPTIGMGGGCNPIHLEHRVEGGEIVIAEADLLREEARFTHRIP
jgi:FTR1 family protein